MTEVVGPADLVFALLAGGDVDGAAQEASRLRPQLVLEAIDYQDVAEHAERYRDLVVAWLPLVDPLNRPEIAAWFVDNSVADLAYLDDQRSAATLLVNSLRGSIERAATLLATLETVAYGPDAGVTRDQAGAAQATAEELRAVAALIEDV